MFGRLSREPQGGKPYRIMAIVGCFIFLAGAFGFASPSAEQGLRLMSLGIAVQGLGFISLNAAELLPKNRTRAATLLRFSAITFLALSAGTVLAALWFMLG